MTFSSDNFNADNSSSSFNFDFTDVQRRELANIIVDVLISRADVDDDNDSNLNFSSDSVSQSENRINE